MTHELFITVALVSLLCAPGHSLQKVTPPTTRPNQTERITNNLYRIGKVMADTLARTVTCSGVVNMDEGAIEYLAVAPGGKLHESLLRIDVQPIHLQLALLMINLEPRNVLKFQGDTTKPQGDAVAIRITWRDSKGISHTSPAEALMVEMPGEKPSAPHSWVFTGSRIFKEVGFEAEAERSLIAVWHDPAAILDNPAPAGALNVYAVSRTCPHKGTPVEVEISAIPALGLKPQAAPKSP